MGGNLFHRIRQGNFCQSGAVEEGVGVDRCQVLRQRYIRQGGTIDKQPGGNCGQTGDGGRPELLAVGEAFVTHRGDVDGEINGGQVTVGKTTMSDRHDGIRQSNLSQPGAVFKSVAADGGQGVGQRDLFQRGHIAEGVSRDSCDTLGNGDGLQRRAVRKRCIIVAGTLAVIGVVVIGQQGGPAQGKVDFSQGGAVAERMGGDPFHTVRENDLGQGGAVVKCVGENLGHSLGESNFC